MTRSRRVPLVLASASPRRARLLRMLGIEPVIDPPRVDETERAGESPAEHVERLARLKASAVAPRHPGLPVLAGDTVVVRDGRIVGKPDGPDDAVQTLLSLAGRAHSVLTGLALALPADDRADQPCRPPASARAASLRVLVRVDEAEVRFRNFERGVAEAYVATGEPLGKAGSYAIQGLGAALVTRVEGDYYTVVGLPVSGLVALLEEAGRPFDFEHPPGTPARPHPDPDRP